MDLCRRTVVLAMFSSLLSFVESMKIPAGYSLHVYHDCGYTVQENLPIVAIETDLSLKASAKCQNGVFEFFTQDGIYFDLYASFSMADAYYCIFERLNKTNTYMLTVSVFWGDINEVIYTHNREYVVICNFDKKGQNESKQTEMTDPKYAPLEIARHLGNKTTSKLTLDVVDVRDDVLTGSIRFGRYIRLKATTDGSNKEIGLRPLSCDAVGIPSGVRHAIIRAGCGDGSIFNRSHGFVTRNLTAFSPYFAAFQINHDISLDFECNLTLCFTNCDGSSCANARRRRSLYVPRTGIAYFIKSKPLIIIKDASISEDFSGQGLPTFRKVKSPTILYLTGSFVTMKQLGIMAVVFIFLFLLLGLCSLYNYRPVGKKRVERHPYIVKFDDPGECQSKCECPCQSKCECPCQSKCECPCQSKCECPCQSKCKCPCQSKCECPCPSKCECPCQSKCSFMTI